MTAQIVDEVLEANERYAAEFGDKGRLPMPPGRHFAILTCMTRVWIRRNMRGWRKEMPTVSEMQADGPATMLSARS